MLSVVAPHSRALLIDYAPNDQRSSLLQPNTN